jgi:signal transduction histidine kinase
LKPGGNISTHVRIITVAFLLLLGQLVFESSSRAAAPEQVDIRTIRQNLHRFGTNPVTLTGTVALQTRRGTFFMQEGKESILVILSNGPAFRPGDRVLVQGIISPDGFSPYLIRASASLIGRTNAPTPVRIKPSDAVTGEYDGRLVSIAGELLLPPERYGDTWTLLLRGGDHFFRADMVSSNATPGLAHLLPRSVVRLSGVCTVGGGSGPRRIYRILFSEPESVAITQAPPWLSLERALKLLGFTSILALVVFAWVVTLRRRVKQQTALIVTQAQEHATRLERTVQERTAGMKRAVDDMQVFSYGVSHDLQSPLRSIYGLCEILVDEHRSTLKPEALAYVHRIQQAARKLSRLTEDLLVYSRITSGEIALDKVSLHDVVMDVTGAVPIPDTRQVQIEVASSLPTVLGHYASIRQVLENLIVNAIKHAGHGKESLHILVRAEERDGWIRVSVKDDGIGIAPEYQEKAFQIFQRLSTSSEGSGIGLAVVKRAVEKMGGRIGIDSQVNAGSTFWFELRGVASASPN